MKTGFVYDPKFLDHRPGPGHPECPERLSVTLDFLQRQEWFSKLSQIRAESADEKWIREIHRKEYLKRAADICEAGQAFLDVPDVGISPDSLSIAYLAAGSGLALADRLMGGEIRNGFALFRPPGHHAEAGTAMGFCLLNNIAITARYLQKKHGLEKIAILDWDVHHGNGTQHIFEEDPSVFYISLHQFPHYPGTGKFSETGIGRGEGATLNCPFPAGSGDAEYYQAFMAQVVPAVEQFKPDAILISAGFDAHHSDPLSGINLSAEFFGWMTEQTAELAAKYSRGRILSFLEGGYCLNYLPQCIGVHLSRLVLAAEN